MAAFVRTVCTITMLGAAAPLGAQGGQPTTPAATPVFLNINPSWSPDGRQLVFESARTGRTGLYIINVTDGSGLTRITRGTEGIR